MWAALLILAQMVKEGLVEPCLFRLAVTLRAAPSLSFSPSARAPWRLQLAALAEQLLAGWVSEMTVIKRWDGLALSSRSRATPAAPPPYPPCLWQYSVYTAKQREQGKTEGAQKLSCFDFLSASAAVFPKTFCPCVKMTFWTLLDFIHICIFKQHKPYFEVGMHRVSNRIFN